MHKFDGEKSENVHQFEGGGRREKATVNYHDIPPLAIRRIASVFSEGIARYGQHTWQGLPWDDTFDHAMEHLQQYQEGDRSVDHLAKCCWAFITQMWRDENQSKIVDDTAAQAGLWQANYVSQEVSKRKLYQEGVYNPDTNTNEAAQVEPTSDFTPHSKISDELQQQLETLQHKVLLYAKEAYLHREPTIQHRRNAAIDVLIRYEKANGLS